MAELRNPKRNNWSTLADVLTAAKRKANKYEVKDWVPLQELVLVICFLVMHQN